MCAPSQGRQRVRAVRRGYAVDMNADPDFCAPLGTREDDIDASATPEGDIRG